MKTPCFSRAVRLAPLLLAALCLLSPLSARATDYKVLVVMSYEENNPWVKEIKEGIDATLGKRSDTTYFYMNTKADREGGQKRADEALALFRQIKPDGVIAADDDAQTLFVVPYLKNQVPTPVIFNGVNAAPEKYGFPASNVSGVLERAHVRESLAFIKQLIPEGQQACFMTNQVPPGLALRSQVESEKDSYPMKVQAFHLPKTVAEIEGLRTNLRKHCDVLFVDSLEGITDATGKALNYREVISVVHRVYGGPVLAGNRYQVEQGALAAVVKTGQEQGELAAQMLLQAMEGQPTGKLPILRNTRGQRIINVSAMEARGIPLRPAVLRGAALVKQEP